MNAPKSGPLGNSKLILAVVAGSFVAFSLAFSPANAEKLYSKLTKEDAAELSGPLKTFICLGERLVPDWCGDYLDFKLNAKVRVENVVSKENAATGPLTFEQEIALQPDFLDIPEDVAVVPPKPEVVQATAREREWKVFLGAGNFTGLTVENLELLIEMANSNSHPEANEILGFAYTNGSGVVGKSKVKAYRHYGIAYLKGMVRVKPNMDVLWKKFSKSEQFSLVHEFKKLKDEAKYISTSMNN
ncbi:MAG: hypothetical protein HOE62_14755 [Alphaproteobacteria bacterium]|jgi:hypothetical protein|nr:hypothetical protein [Alphaproteobacteria bacterium]MBT4967247.1 hypothetical protein [Alphaproteobacteria bacterium]